MLNSVTCKTPRSTLPAAQPRLHRRAALVSGSASLHSLAPAPDRRARPCLRARALTEERENLSLLQAIAAYRDLDLEMLQDEKKITEDWVESEKQRSQRLIEFARQQSAEHVAAARADRDMAFNRDVEDRDRYQAWYHAEVERTARLASYLTRAYSESLSAREAVHLRAAVGLAAEHLSKRTRMGDAQRVLTQALHEEEEYQKCIELVAAKQNLEPELVQAAVRHICDTLSKFAHESEEVPTIRLSLYSRVEAVAIACTLATACIRFVVIDELGQDVTADFRCDEGAQPPGTQAP